MFANLRPVKVRSSLQDVSPIKPERIAGVDFMVVRELTGGLYFGQPKGRGRTADGHERAVDTLEYTDYEVRRVVEFAFRLAAGRRRKVTSVDKANVLEASRLWRQVTAEVGAQHPEIALDHILVDTAAMRIITAPRDFDVIVTDNMFGDILTDEASVLAGSMGMLPSASLGSGRAGALRADPRLGPGYRRKRNRQSDRGDIKRRNAFPVFAGLGEGSRRDRAGGGPGVGCREPDRGPSPVGQTADYKSDDGLRAGGVGIIYSQPTCCKDRHARVFEAGIHF